MKKKVFRKEGIEGKKVGGKKKSVLEGREKQKRRRRRRHNRKVECNRGREGGGKMRRKGK